MCTDCNPDLIMAQATSEPPLRSRRENNKTRHIFISLFFFFLKDVHIISCLKLQSSAAKHISAVCGVGGVDVPCLQLSLRPTPALQLAFRQRSSQKYQRWCIHWGLCDLFLHRCCLSCKNPFQSQLLFSGTDKQISVNESNLF